MTIQIDASAVLATLLDEPGADVVYTAMADAAISVVNLCEIYTKLIQQGVEPDVAEHQVSRLDLRLMPFMPIHATEAAKLRPLTIQLGLSLGDRACIAHGIVDHRQIVIAARKWAKLDLASTSA